MDKLISKVANDTGNGYMDVSINGNDFRIPSVIAKLRNNDNYRIEEFGDKESEKEFIEKTFLHELIASVNSPLIKREVKYIIGENATVSALRSYRLNIYNGKQKHKQEEGFLLSFAMIAGNSVKEFYEENGEIPSVLKVDVSICASMPIIDSKDRTAIEQLKKAYTQSEHIVSFYNFDKPVQVHLNFVDAIITCEGEIGKFQIELADDELKRFIKEDFDKHYPEYQNSSLFEAEKLISLSNMLIVDIGEGTTELAIFKEDRMEFSSSTSISSGYGSVLDNALMSLTKPLKHSERILLKDRSELVDLLKDNRETKKTLVSIAKEHVHEAEFELTEDIFDGINLQMKDSINRIDAVYVFGGGSIPMENILRPLLVDFLEELSDNEIKPVIFINKKYATSMNRLGLQRLVEDLL